MKDKIAICLFSHFLLIWDTSEFCWKSRAHPPLPKSLLITLLLEPNFLGAFLQWASGVLVNIRCGVSRAKRLAVILDCSNTDRNELKMSVTRNNLHLTLLIPIIWNINNKSGHRTSLARTGTEISVDWNWMFLDFSAFNPFSVFLNLLQK